MMDYAGRAAQADTYPKLLRLNAKEHGGEIALREKDFGLWRAFTWNDYQTRVHDFALGLVELGLGRGDVIGIIGDNRPDWVSAEIATHAIGAMSLGLYRDVLDEEAAYLLTYGEAKLVFAEDEEQVDKLLTLAERVPNLKHIVYSDPRGMRKYDDPRLMEADKLAADGQRARRARARPVRPTGGCDQRRGRRDPLHHLGHHGASEAGDAGRGARAAALRDLSRVRSQGTGRRIRLGAAAALDHGAGLCARQRPAVPDEGQLRRAGRDHDERFPRDRADLCPVCAAGVGVDRRRCPRRRDGFLPAQAEPLPDRHEDGAGGAGARQAFDAGGHAAVPRAARPPRLHPPALGRDRRRRARPRYLQVLPGHGRAAAHAVRPDRNARRLHPSPRGPGRSRHHGRADGRQHRNPHRQSGHSRRRRDHGAPSQHVPRLFQEPGSLRRRHHRRLDAFRRCRLFQQPTSSSW